MDMSVAASACISNVLSIQILGKFELRLDGQLIELNSRKARALLGYLVLNESSGETRERLVGLLWSDSDEERARGSLRQCLREIKTALPPSLFDGFIAERLEISLDRARLDVDLWKVLGEARAGDAPLRLLDGPELLDGMLQELQTVDEQFGSWLRAKRQAVKERILRHLEARLREVEPGEDLAMRLARVILNLDPTHEEACRGLMRALAARGDAAGAQRVYKKLWDVLDDEFDSRPDEQTQDLVAAIKAAIPYSGTELSGGVHDAPPARPRVEPSTTRSGAPAAFQPLLSQGAVALHDPEPDRGGQLVTLPAVRSGLQRVYRDNGLKLVLSVAPFALSNCEAPGYLLQGFRRELIASLVRFREWVVREPNGDLHARGGDTDEYVLEADGLQLGKSIRLSLTLKEVASNDFLWSEIVDLNLESLFDVQRVVVRRIATALNVHLSAGRMTAIAPRPIENLKAYDIWLLGQATILSFDPEKWAKSEAMFRQVIEEDPEFAPAYSSLAQIYNLRHIVTPGIEREPAHRQTSIHYAREAARRDPIDSRSQLCLGWSYAMAKHYEQAMTHVPLAYELNSSDPWTVISSANLYAFCGDHARAGQLAQEVLRLPMEPSPIQWAYHASIRFLAGDYAGAVDAGLAAGNASPTSGGYTAAALFHLGRGSEARDSLEQYFSTIRERWVGSGAADPAAITRWFLYLFPIANPQEWMQLRDGIRGAGGPTDGLRHHDW